MRMGRTAYVARVRALARSQRAQRVAAACANGLRKVCGEVGSVVRYNNI